MQGSGVAGGCDHPGLEGHREQLQCHGCVLGEVASQRRQLSRDSAQGRQGGEAHPGFSLPSVLSFHKKQRHRSGQTIPCTSHRSQGKKRSARFALGLSHLGPGPPGSRVSCLCPPPPSSAVLVGPAPQLSEEQAVPTTRPVASRPRVQVGQSAS